MTDTKRFWLAAGGAALVTADAGAALMWPGDPFATWLVVIAMACALAMLACGRARDPGGELVAVGYLGVALLCVLLSAR